MKKLICIIIAVIMICGTLSSCTSSAERELERAQKATKPAREDYENVSRQYDDLSSRLDSIMSKLP